MVVGHGEGHRVGVGLAQVALGIVGHPVPLVLIPVHRCLVVAVLGAVAVVLGVALVVEDFPSAANQLVGAGRHVGLLQSHRAAWQHNGGRLQGVDERGAALELQVYINNV